MAKMDPVVKRETEYVAIWVMAGCILIQGVFLVLHLWNLTVLWGSLLGGATAIGNFLLMGLTVQKALNKDKKKAAQTIQMSQSGRLLLQGAVLVLAGVCQNVFNLWTTIIPLIIPTIAVRIRHLMLAKNNPSPDRPAIGWDEDEEDD